MFYPYKGYGSVTPLDAARVDRTICHIINTSYQKLPFGSGDDPDKLFFFNRTISHNHSVH